MLQTDCEFSEKILLDLYNNSKILTHTVTEGNARELFVKSFLQSHIPASYSIGSGEAFEYSSLPKSTKTDERRNQIDVLIYKNDYPKISFGDTGAYLIEGIVATIEVKSCLDEAAVIQAVKTARALKKMKLTTTGGKKRYLYCSLIGYTSNTDDMKTVASRLSKAEEELENDSITGHNEKFNNGYDAPSIDCVVALGKGVVHAYNSRLGFVPPVGTTSYRWLYANGSTNNLLVWYLQLLAACGINKEINVLQYLKDRDLSWGVNAIP